MLCTIGSKCRSTPPPSNTSELTHLHTLQSTSLLLAPCSTPAYLDDRLKMQVNTSILQADEALSVAENVVTFSMDLYPSPELEQQFLTDQPVIYAVVVGVIFLVTSLAFMTYDYLVTNNQNRLTRMAGSP